MAPSFVYRPSVQVLRYQGSAYARPAGGAAILRHGRRVCRTPLTKFESIWQSSSRRYSALSTGSEQCQTSGYSPLRAEFEVGDKKNSISKTGNLREKSENEKISLSGVVMWKLAIFRQHISQSLLGPRKKRPSLLEFACRKMMCSAC